jgi:hypothetical protein
MFETLRAAQSIVPDLCATIGQCSANPPAGRDPAKSAQHFSSDGLYTADQVRRFRNCSNNYTLKFDPIIKFDPSTTKDALKGYKPQGGNELIESFRMCWDEIKLH